VKEEVHVVLGERALRLRGAGGRRPGSCYDGRGREEQPQQEEPEAEAEAERMGGRWAGGPTCRCQSC
jgi:hypothetical protein